MVKRYSEEAEDLMAGCDNHICPVCKQNPILPPHEVCSVCYEKAKNKSGLNDVLKEVERKDKEGITYDHYLIDDWEEIDAKGLQAVKLIGEFILDSIEDDDQHQWHLRRIRFMQDMIECLDVSYFAPATRQQIYEFAQNAVDFWSGKFDEIKAKDLLKKMRGIIHKDIMKNSDWEPKDFLLWMMYTEDNFDWMWYQWFECIRCCIPDKCNDDLWIKMFHKHFHNEIQSWLSSLD